MGVYILPAHDGSNGETEILVCRLILLPVEQSRMSRKDKIPGMMPIHPSGTRRMGAALHWGAVSRANEQCLLVLLGQSAVSGTANWQARRRIGGMLFIPHAYSRSLECGKSWSEYYLSPNTSKQVGGLIFLGCPSFAQGPPQSKGGCGWMDGSTSIRWGGKWLMRWPRGKSCMHHTAYVSTIVAYHDANT